MWGDGNWHGSTDTLEDGDGVGPGDMPEHEPLFEALWVDGGGRLWVAPHSGAEALLPGFDLFDDRGRYPGRVQANPAMAGLHPRPEVRGRKIYGVTEDSLGVQYVVRGRIVRPGPGE